MSFSEQLISILSNLENNFDQNELAYLAATSKVEGPIRDKIAYCLHMEIDPSLLAHREWRGRKNRWTDIAITDAQNRPLSLIEIKAHSGPTFEPGYTAKVREDLQKLYHAGEPDTELYFIFLFNHLFHPGTINPKYVYAVKYFDLQNFASRQNDFAEDVSEQTTTHWERHLSELGLLSEKSHKCIQIRGGSYHGMPMTVHAFAYGPMFQSDLKEIFA